jgi:hypothetical protein
MNDHIMHVRKITESTNIHTPTTLNTSFSGSTTLGAGFDAGLEAGVLGLVGVLGSRILGLLLSAGACSSTSSSANRVYIYIYMYSHKYTFYTCIISHTHHTHTLHAHTHHCLGRDLISFLLG